MLAQITNGAAWWQFFGHNKDTFSSIESVFKIGAIVIGGYWAYRAFNRRRERFPKAKVSHAISYWDVSEHERLVRIVLTIANDGDVLLTASSGFTWVQQMKPWPEALLATIRSTKPSAEDGDIQIRWPLVAEKEFSKEREIEPKESDEIHMDFLLDKWYEQVLVYSFVENAAKPGRHLGWEVTNVLAFDKEKEEGTPAMSAEIPDKRQGQAKPRPAPATQPPLKKEVSIQTQPRPTPGGPKKGN